MSGALKTVGSFLDQMGVKYTLDEEKGLILSNWSIEDKPFTVGVWTSGPWLIIRGYILPKSMIPREKELQLYRELLNSHYNLAEVRYDIDEEGNIGTTQSIPLEGLNISNFQSEFNAVLYAIKFFLTEIAGKLEIEV
ncbi:MAG: hypothetical protein DRO05_00485 [Thermoproteota archaeon]|nr:MAG: hypothetical protein DRO05_00485 [Candidatus Korarchaeota archaeon]